VTAEPELTVPPGAAFPAEPVLVRMTVVPSVMELTV